MIEARRLQRLFERVWETRRNCRFEDLARLLLAVGFEKHHPSGSHVVFRHGIHKLSIPARSPVNREYVKMSIRAVKEILENGQAR